MNEKQKNPTPKKKILRFKHDMSYYFISEFLSIIYGFGIIFDKRFYELLKQLEDYVDSHLTVPEGMDIVDYYVISECVPADVDKN